MDAFNSVAKKESLQPRHAVILQLHVRSHILELLKTSMTMKSHLAHCQSCWNTHIGSYTHRQCSTSSTGRGNARRIDKCRQLGDKRRSAALQCNTCEITDRPVKTTPHSCLLYTFLLMHFGRSHMSSHPDNSKHTWGNAYFIGLFTFPSVWKSKWDFHKWNWNDVCFHMLAGEGHFHQTIQQKHLLGEMRQIPKMFTDVQSYKTLKVFADVKTDNFFQLFLHRQYVWIHII